MSNISIGQGIEKGEYLTTSDAAMLNQWNRKSVNTNGANPLAALSYTVYSEFGATTAFELKKLGIGSCLTNYTLATDNDAFSVGTYCLSYMINVIQRLTTGVIMFDGNVAGKYRRVVLGGNNTGTGSEFKFRFNGEDDDDSNVATETAPRDYITTYLVVLKLNPLIGIADMFVNPTISVNGPTTSSASIATTDLATAGIKAITVRQRTNYGVIIGGLRFATTLKAAIGLDNITLPLSFYTFTATSEIQGVKLQWRTLSEQDNKEFIILQSVDGKDFRPITTIAGSGNSSSPKSYQFYNRSAVNCINYHKLSQVDNDGKKIELDIKSVIFNLTSHTLNLIVSPNPSSNEASVKFKPNVFHTLLLINLQGRILHGVFVGKDVSKVKLDLRQYITGTYLVKLQGAQATEIGKLIKP